MEAAHHDEMRARLRAGRVSLFVGCVVLAGKLAAFVITGSAAVLSDALESIVNVVAAALLLYSLIVAARPADRSHPYGHGKVEFFSMGVEGTLIAVAALLILVEAARDLWRGPKVERIDLGLILVTLLTLANAGLGLYLLRVGRRTHSFALQADGQHVLTDVATSVGVIVGLAAVWLTGWVVLDPLVAIGVALNILRTGWSLVRSAVAGLMDEADESILAAVAEELEKGRDPWCIDVHGLRAWRSGAFHHADLHVCVPRYFDAGRLHEIDTALKRRVLGAVARPGDVIVHFDPCLPRDCEGCAMEACAVRTTLFDARRPIDLERATRTDDTP
jgi:cation diffusion facilitator family transporter